MLTAPNSPTNNLTRSSASSNRLPSLADIRDEKCRRDPLYWGQTWTLTENPKYKEQGLEFRSPFPSKSYFAPLFEEFKRSKHLFVPKTREMLTSWCVVLYATHLAQWHKAQVIIQTEKEDKASELVSYAECLYRNQKDWLKARHKLKHASSLSLQWEDGGELFGIPKGVNQIRMFHPTLTVFDEAAFLPEFQQCFDTAVPVSAQIIAISSAGPGFFGDQCTR